LLALPRSGLLDRELLKRRQMGRQPNLGDDGAKRMRSAIFFTKHAMLRVLILIASIMLAPSLAGSLLLSASTSHGEVHKMAAVRLPDGEIAVGSIRIGEERETKPWIARLDPQGRTLWWKTPGEDGEELNTVVALPGDRFATGIQIYTGGNNARAISFDAHGNVLWKQYFGEGAYSVSSIAALPDGSVLVAGGDSSGAASTRWAARVSSRGELVWSRAFDSTGNNGTAYAIAPLAGGAIVAGQRWRSCFCEGYHYGAPWAARLDESGGIIWSKDFGPDMSFPVADGRNPDYVLCSAAVAPDGAVTLKGDGVEFVKALVTRKVAVWQLRVDLDGNVTGKDYSAAADGHTPCHSRE
jgi:hypothetical protein